MPVSAVGLNVAGAPTPSSESWMRHAGAQVAFLTLRPLSTSWPNFANHCRTPDRNFADKNHSEWIEIEDQIVRIRLRLDWRSTVKVCAHLITKAFATRAGLGVLIHGAAG